MTTDTIAGYTLTATRELDEAGELFAVKVAIAQAVSADVGDGKSGETLVEIADVWIDADTGCADIYYADGEAHFCDVAAFDAFAAAVRHCWCLAGKEVREEEARSNAN
jgi:hypothetical protein